jgi:type II restriction enzyme
MKSKYTAANLVSAISKLSKRVWFDYPAESTTTQVKILSVKKPDGPLMLERKVTKNGKCTLKKQSCSKAMLSRLANAITEGIPLNVDRVLGASYNTRSSLEALLVHTPQFYLCYPGRIQYSESSHIIKKGHKHLIWLPQQPHAQGLSGEYDCKGMTVVERPSVETVYGVLEITPDADALVPLTARAEEAQRRHIQIQVALAKIGHLLGFRTYIAVGDQNVLYDKKPLLALPDVVQDLRDERLLSINDQAPEAIRYIDCVWFRNGSLMPAVMEVEDSTGTWTGLRRMQTFRNLIPNIETRYVVVAPDEDRESVLAKIADPQFASLKAKFFPYSAVEELQALCEKRKIKGRVTDAFLDSFMEPD